jgi:hypothetical protein
MGNLDLHVERSGGPGPTVVFVHGGAVDLRLFDGVVSLVGARWNVRRSSPGSCCWRRC